MHDVCVCKVSNYGCARAQQRPGIALWEREVRRVRWRRRRTVPLTDGTAPVAGGAAGGGACMRAAHYRGAVQSAGAAGGQAAGQGEQELFRQGRREATGSVSHGPPHPVTREVVHFPWRNHQEGGTNVPIWNMAIFRTQRSGIALWKRVVDSLREEGLELEARWGGGGDRPAPGMKPLLRLYRDGRLVMILRPRSGMLRIDRLSAREAAQVLAVLERCRTVSLAREKAWIHKLRAMSDVLTGIFFFVVGIGVLLTLDRFPELALQQLLAGVFMALTMGLIGASGARRGRRSIAMLGFLGFIPAFIFFSPMSVLLLPYIRWYQRALFCGLAEGPDRKPLAAAGQEAAWAERVGTK